MLVFRSGEGPEGESTAVGGFGAGVAVAVVGVMEDAVVVVEVMENIAVVPRGGDCMLMVGVWCYCGIVVVGWWGFGDEVGLSVARKVRWGQVQRLRESDICLPNYNDDSIFLIMAVK